MRQIARRDPEDQALLTHAAECEICRESRAVTTWMQQLAALPVNSDSMPADPHHLWWKAEMLRRWDAQWQATAPLEVGERVIIGIGLAAAVTLLRWLWNGPAQLAADAGQPATLPNLLTAVVITSVLVLAATTFVAVRDMFDGD